MREKKNLSELQDKNVQELYEGGAMIYNAFKRRIFKSEEKEFYTQQEAPRGMPLLESEEPTAQKINKAK